MAVASGSSAADNECSVSLDWDHGVEAFMLFSGLAASTTAAYGETLERVGAVVGAGEDLDSEALRAAMDVAFEGCEAASWNRHVSALRSFFGFLREQGIVTADLSAPLRRRRQRQTTSSGQRVMSREAIAGLCADPAHGLRDRTLWTVAYESAARAGEVLQLDVQRVDLVRRRSAIVGKGGDVETILWSTASNRRLHRLVRGRSRGPVFVTEAAGRIKAAEDTCEQTGRVRLSYRRAAELFKAASGGSTLHQLRHSRLTHLAEDGKDVMMLRALSRHSTVRSLEVYVRPSDDAVASMLSASGL